MLGPDTGSGIIRNCEWRNIAIGFDQNAHAVCGSHPIRRGTYGVVPSLEPFSGTDHLECRSRSMFHKGNLKTTKLSLSETGVQRLGGETCSITYQEYAYQARLIGLHLTASEMFLRQHLKATIYDGSV